MSFCKTNDLIQEGDTAIIYLSFSQLYPIKVTRGLSHHTQYVNKSLNKPKWAYYVKRIFTFRYGQLKHNDIIGKKYGSKFQYTRGHAYVLQGSPEIWTISLPHRTQIIVS
jgi:tRNA (adenine57-N1/adenine58-N1)-methyltransferase